MSQVKEDMEDLLDEGMRAVGTAQRNAYSAVESDVRDMRKKMNGIRITKPSEDFGLRRRKLESMKYYAEYIVDRIEMHLKHQK